MGGTGARRMERADVTRLLVIDDEASNRIVRTRVVDGGSGRSFSHLAHWSNLNRGLIGQWARVPHWSCLADVADGCRDRFFSSRLKNLEVRSLNREAAAVNVEVIFEPKPAVRASHRTQIRSARDHTAQPQKHETEQ